MNPRRLAFAALLLALAALAWWIDPLDLRGQANSLARGLARRGRVVSVGSTTGLPTASGTRFEPLTAQPTVRDALAGEDGSALARALRAGHLAGVLIEPRSLPAWASDASVLAHLTRYQEVTGLVGRYLARDAALYVPDPLAQIPERHREALALVARRILSGERPPRIQSFPESLRAVAHVEVMVLLRSGPRARLWRSARGSSIARAFLTAVRVAGQRWDERAQAMGAPLAEALPGLAVEISLLQDDGEIGTRTGPFVDLVIGPEHGVAYDRKGAWRYLLPAATRELGRPSQALTQLLADNGLPADAIDRDEIRPYRLRVRQLAVSDAPRIEPDPLGAVEDPSELVGHGAAVRPGPGARQPASPRP